MLCFQLAIGVSIMISTLVDASESVSWRVSIGSASVPALLMLLVTLTLLATIDLFGVGQVFWIYGVFNVAAFLFVWRRMPELTGHSLEDVEKHLQDGELRPADFRTA